MTIPVVPNSTQLSVEQRAQAEQQVLQQRETILQEIELGYKEVEPFLMWLDENDEEIEFAPEDPVLITQGLRGLLDDEQRKAMFAKMGDKGGGGLGSKMGTGAVGKALGAGKKGLTGAKGLGGKAAGAPKGIGKGIGSAVGKAASAPGNKIAAFKASRAPKAYNRRMAGHARASQRDLQSAKSHRDLAAYHTELAKQHDTTANYHRASAQSLDNGSKMGLLGTALGIQDRNGMTYFDHRNAAQEHGHTADFHRSEATEHHATAKHYAASAKQHAATSVEMAKNNPYKTTK